MLYFNDISVLAHLLPMTRPISRLALQVGWKKGVLWDYNLDNWSLMEFGILSHTSRSSSCPASNLWTVPLLQYGATAVRLSLIICLKYLSSSSQTETDRKGTYVPSPKNRTLKFRSPCKNNPNPCDSLDPHKL